ncbi:hypothetical protein M404DRAFT_997995 [Pisolithus tinctorius Marx 270]|uniref:Uncharacterized protein n=1 Tax=Pisolithus tinctorius Marx 270 TaxID=870435 RepID=A0A0C3JFK8_PISTI|nr:hypothetical protein M404DRAFT_997995 [Pisolithus tinctorius Marx 270]
MSCTPVTGHPGAHVYVCERATNGIPAVCVGIGWRSDGCTLGQVHKNDLHKYDHIAH